jgi:hypothetical protein
MQRVTSKPEYEYVYKAIQVSSLLLSTLSTDLSLHLEDIRAPRRISLRDVRPHDVLTRLRKISHPT